MRIRIALPEGGGLGESEKKGVLDAALEAVTRAATPLVANRQVPTASAAIRAGRVHWKPEPPGDEHFDLPTTVLARGWGDCDDLAPWHAASLRASGTDPKARAVVKKSGPGRWHALVQRADGSIEDPSLAAGMGSRVSGVDGPFFPGLRGAIQRPMFPEGRMAFASHPLLRGFAGRVDVKDRHNPWHWSALSCARRPGPAVARAIRAVSNLVQGDDDDDTHIILGACHDMLTGADADEILDSLDHLGVDTEDPEVVGFFGGLLQSAGKLAKSVAPIASVIPGGGLATTAIQAASSLVPGDSKKSPTTAPPVTPGVSPGIINPGAPAGFSGMPPVMPIIVRF